MTALDMFFVLLCTGRYHVHVATLEITGLTDMLHCTVCD